MKHRRRLAAILWVVLAPAQAAQDCGTAQWESFIAEAAERFTLPPSWLHAVMRAESAGCVRIDGKPTTSSAGAMGLMQLMPQTWATLRDRHGLGDDPHDPRDNILAGAAYLAELYDSYGRDGAFAAYHAGPRRYDEHLAGTRSLPAATQDYTARVHRWLGSVREQSPAGAPPDSTGNGEIFVRNRHGARAVTLHDEQQIHRPLFAPLSRDRSRVDRAPDEGSHVQPAE